MPEEKKKRNRQWDESEKGIAYRRKYNEEHYARIGLYVSPALRARIDKYCDRNGISKNTFASEAFEDYLAAHEDETGTE